VLEHSTAVSPPMPRPGGSSAGRPPWSNLAHRTIADLEAAGMTLRLNTIYSCLTVDEVSDPDLSYTPPPGSPWDAVQAGAQAWTRHARRMMT
jgi:hypothetical protein